MFYFFCRISEFLNIFEYFKTNIHKVSQGLNALFFLLKTSPIKKKQCFQIEFAVKHKQLIPAESKTYSLRIKINGVNDPPELVKRSKDEKLLIASRGSRVITNEILILTDADDRPEKVRVQVVESSGVHIEVHGQKVNEFSHKQLIEELVSLVDEGTELGSGRIR